MLQYIIYYTAMLIHKTQLDVFHEDFNKDYDAAGGGKDFNALFSLGLVHP